MIDGVSIKFHTARRLGPKIQHESRLNVTEYKEKSWKLAGWWGALMKSAELWMGEIGQVIM